MSAVFTSSAAAALLGTSPEEVRTRIAAARKTGKVHLIPKLSSPRLDRDGKQHRVYFWNDISELVKWWVEALQLQLELKEVGEMEEENAKLEESADAKDNKVFGELGGMYNSYVSTAKLFGVPYISYEDFRDHIIGLGLAAYKKEMRERVDNQFKR